MSRLAKEPMHRKLFTVELYGKVKFFINYQLSVLYY